MIERRVTRSASYMQGTDAMAGEFTGFVMYCESLLRDAASAWQVRRRALP